MVDIVPDQPGGEAVQWLLDEIRKLPLQQERRLGHSGLINCGTVEATGRASAQIVVAREHDEMRRNHQEAA